MNEVQIVQCLNSLLPAPFRSQIRDISLSPLSSKYKLKAANKAQVYNVIVSLRESAYYPVGTTFTLCKYFDDCLYFSSVQEAVKLTDPEATTMLVEEIKIIFSTTSMFGCCSKYEQCSDNRACIHENPFYSYGCTYRKNLDSGKIFYGKNKNV